MARTEQRGKSWYSRWTEPGGRERRKSWGPGTLGKQLAEKHARQVAAQIQAGIYITKPANLKWGAFVLEYRDRIIEPQSLESAELHWAAVQRFGEYVKPTYIQSVTQKDLETFIALRKQDPGNGGPISPATINKDLAYLKTMFNHAYDWEYLKKRIKVKMLRVPQKIDTYIDETEFSAIYKACPDDWWRGFLLFQFMTGWRLAQVLALTWDCVDLERGEIFSHAEDNKGKRDVLLPLHDVLVGALAKIQQPTGKVFPHKGDETRLYPPFRKIQENAGIKPRNKREGLWYGFHDLRRGFATVNADKLDLFELQKLMQHRDIKTTQRYVAMAHRLRPAVENLTVPDLG